MNKLLVYSKVGLLDSCVCDQDNVAFPDPTTAEALEFQTLEKILNQIGIPEEVNSTVTAELTYENGRYIAKIGISPGLTSGPSFHAIDYIESKLSELEKPELIRFLS